MYTLLAQINIFLLLLLGDKRYLELQVLKQKIMKKLRIYPDADNPYWQKMIKRYKGLEGKIPLPLGIGGGSILLANGSSLLYDALYGGAIRNYNKFFQFFIVITPRTFNGYAEITLDHFQFFIVITCNIYL